jgi:SNF2 family DNA or RNA helicase
MPIGTADTRVEIIGPRIFLHTGFANLLLCKRIPGGAWDTERRAWSYPATPQAARLIKGYFKGVASESLNALANRKPRRAQVPSARPAEVTPPKPAQAPPATIPNLKTSPWKHQILAYQFLRSIFQPEGGWALLAMGMGTGKSLTTIGAACNLDADLILVICPLRVVDVWPLQFRLHAGIPIRVLALGDDAGTVAQKMKRASDATKLAQTRGERLAIVINYESLWRDPFAQWALAQKWGLVICDESHRIKKPSGKASVFCGRLRTRSRYRLALTGTPMPHSPLDIYGQFRFLDNRILGNSYHAFKQRFAVMGGFQQKQVVAYRNLEELEALMRTITFRVGKDVLDLPPETHVTYHCDLTPDGARAYKALEKDFVAEVKEGLITAANAMVKLLRLQQITGGTVKTDDDRFVQIDQSKQSLLADTLEDIGTDRADGFEASGEPVVVFCRFHSDLDAVHAAAASLGFTSMELSGRRDDLKEWQAGKAQVLAVQISAGGVGVDLTRARYNIYYSLSYSLGEYDQSLSRVHRPGQTRPVTHIHLVARGTVDEKVIRALEARAEVIESILNQIKEQA